MSQNFSLLTNVLLSAPTVPMTPNVPVELYNSGPIAGSSSDKTLNSARVTIDYKAFVPDTSEDNLPNVTPYRFGVVAIVEQEQEDNTWVEIGRQNSALSELHSGKEREIYISPQPTSNEEGVDITAVGLLDQNVKLKSSWQDDTSGELRVRIIAMQGIANGDSAGPPVVIANPFESVTVCISGQRFSS